MEDDGELRAEQEDEARHVAPREHGDDRADRAVNLIIVKIVQARREDVLRRLPQQPGHDRAGDGIAQLDAPARHEAIDEREERDRHGDAHRGEDDLPESVADEGEDRHALQHAQGEAFGQLFERDEQVSNDDRDDEQHADAAHHAEGESAPVQKGARLRAPQAVDGALHHVEDPGACPQRDDDAGDDDARADVLQRADGRAQEIARAGIGFHGARQHLAAHAEVVAQREQHEEHGEESEQPEVAHGGGGREQIVFVELMKRVAEDVQPRRGVAHAEVLAGV